MLLMLLVLVPLILARAPFPSFLAYFSLASLGPPLLYAFSQQALYPKWLEKYKYFPLLPLLGIGLAFNNSVAVVEALLGRPSTFRRTPKYNIRTPDENWAKRQYVLGLGWESIGELALFVYALVGAAGAWKTGNVWIVPFMVLYALGFGYVAGLSLWHSPLFARARPGNAQAEAILPNA